MVDKVNDVIDFLELAKTWASKEGAEALEYAQMCVKSRAPEYEYRMVRSFAPSCNQSGDMLDRYLKAGYEFVRASEFIPPQQDKAGYIEYVLRRKKEDTRNED